jgi:tRNA A37 threonylcarbamoyladenosine dehydratase
MNYNQFTRTEILLGSENVQKLQQVRVAVVGLGGVGSYAAEALARAGVGNFLIIDFDLVNLSNLNRQVLALHSTIGESKTRLMQQRILDINPKADVETVTEFLAQENRDKYLSDLDYLIDAIDALGPKIGLIEYCIRHDIPIISVMGAGNRIDPTQIHLSTLAKSWNCPLAKRVRKFLRRRGVNIDIPVVFSTEKPLKPELEDGDEADEIIIHRGRQRLTIGSISYMPAMMGMYAASYVIRDLLNLLPTSSDITR